MKRNLIKTAVIALLAVCIASFVLFFAYADSTLLEIALGATALGAFFLAEKIYKGNLATGD